MKALARGLSVGLFALAAFLWIIPTKVTAGTCFAGNGASCVCSAGEKCKAFDTYCTCQPPAT